MLSMTATFKMMMKRLISFSKWQVNGKCEIATIEQGF